MVRTMMVRCVSRKRMTDDVVVIRTEAAAVRDGACALKDVVIQPKP